MTIPRKKRATVRRDVVALSLAALAALIAFVALAPTAGQAASDAVSDKLASQVEQSQQWQIKADKIAAQHDDEVLEAEGNVLLYQGDNYLKADHATYYRTTGWVHLRGNVEALWTADRLRADEAEFDLRNKVGWLKNGEIFVADPHLYFRGERIEKHAGDRYTFDKATVTACDDPDAWSIDMDEGEITLEGYAWLWGPKFKVKDQPLLYSPLAVLPVKEKRQSGLLMPDLGHSSRLGAHINLPYYWAISDESDATFYENWMSDRGFMQGLEFRHTPDTGSKGLWRFDAMKDQETRETEADEDSQFNDDGLVRPNSTRYWWRSKLDTHLADPKWKFKLDIDWVSDQNYLREFKAGKSGFTVSRDQFLKEFSRDIADADALERESALLVQRSWDKGGVAVKSQWTQNLEYQSGNRRKDRNPTAQRLPELHAYLWKDQVFSSPLEFEGGVSATHFWRRYGTRGSRFEAYPKVSLPIQAGSVSVIPTLGLRETAYAVNEYENRTISTTDGDYTMRHMPTLNVAAFTERYKVYDVGQDTPLDVTTQNAGESQWDKVKHSVQPRVEYDWKPYISQENKPFFDELDRISAQNEITYSLTNLLDRRRSTVNVRKEEGGDDEAYLSTDYLEFLRVRVEQSWDAREATRDDMRDTYERRPFSDILGEVTIQPEDWISLTSRTFWSPYRNEITEHEHVLRGMWEGVGSAEFGLDFQEDIDDYKRRARDRIRQVRYGLDLIVTRRWNVGFTYRADLVTDTDLEKTIKAEYRHQCWSITFLYTITPFEDRVEARIDLLGLSF